MAVDGLTSLTSFAQVSSSNLHNQSARNPAGSHAANVLPQGRRDSEVINRAAGTYSDLVNPKQGPGEVDDESSSGNYYMSSEDEGAFEEESEESLDEEFNERWREIELNSEDPDLVMDEMESQYLRYKSEKGMFLDVRA